MNILIVDDEPEILSILSETLESHSDEIRTVNSGAEALLALQKRTFDIILSDIRMPGMCGLQLLSRLRDSRIYTPFILLTGHGDREYMMEALRLNASGFIEKPFCPDHVIQTIKRAHDHKEGLKCQAPLLIEQEKFSMGQLELDVVMHRAFTVDAQFKTELELTMAEFNILYWLASHSGKYFLINDLKKNLWRERVHVDVRTIYTHIYTLRRKLGVHKKQLQSERGKGYCWISGYTQAEKAAVRFDS